MNPFYSKKHTCPLCETVFTSYSLRPSVPRIEKRDADFHIQYKTHSPTHYNIIVCPECFYACPANSFKEPVSPIQKKSLLRALNILCKDKPKTNLWEQRTLSEVLDSYLLAVKTAQLKKTTAGTLASLLLGVAWICREMDNHELELQYLQDALGQYEINYVNEKIPPGFTEKSLPYLIGVLKFLTGDYESSIRWLDKAYRIKTEDYAGDKIINTNIQNQRYSAKEEYDKNKKA